MKRRGARVAPREAALLLLLVVTIVAYISWKWSNGGGFSKEKGSNQNGNVDCKMAAKRAQRVKSMICPCAGKHWESSPLWAEDNRPQLNPHKFGYILNEPDYCGVGEVVDLLILVASAVRHRDNRDAIRATWDDETQNAFNRLVVQ